METFVHFSNVFSLYTALHNRRISSNFLVFRRYFVEAYNFSTFNFLPFFLSVNRLNLISINFLVGY